MKKKFTLAHDSPGSPDCDINTCLCSREFYDII